MIRPVLSADTDPQTLTVDERKIVASWATGCATRVGTERSGPLGPGLLSKGTRGEIIATLQRKLDD